MLGRPRRVARGCGQNDLSPEVFILALASALRPSTSTAAVYELLSSERPRPVLSLFTVAGMLFSGAIGIVVVLALHGISVPGTGSERIAVADIAAGAAMLVFAAAVRSGRLERLGRRTSSRGPGRVVTMLRSPTPNVAALAGAATHLPGLFYLVALNSIAAGSPPRLEVLLAVLTYNTIWFLVPIGACVVAGRHADWAHTMINAVNAWARQNERVIVVVVFACAGGYLIAKGSAALVP